MLIASRLRSEENEDRDLYDSLPRVFSGLLSVARPRRDCRASGIILVFLPICSRVASGFFRQLIFARQVGRVSWEENFPLLYS